MEARSLDLLDPPAEARRTSALDGDSAIWLPKPGMVMHRISGVLSLPIAEDLADITRPLFERGIHLTFFDDFELMTGYTREARELLTDLSLAYLSCYEGSHILLSAKMSALGVAAYKADVGDERVFAYWDRASFLRSYTEAMDG
jgi:hypothetical protein